MNLYMIVHELQPKNQNGEPRPAAIALTDTKRQFPHHFDQEVELPDDWGSYRWNQVKSSIFKEWIEEHKEKLREDVLAWNNDGRRRKGAVLPPEVYGWLGKYRRVSALSVVLQAVEPDDAKKQVKVTMRLDVTAENR